jgi:hypothetical protein
VEKRIKNIRDLKFAKAELKSKIELNEAKIRMDIDLLKEHYSKAETYLPSGSIFGEHSGLLATTAKTVLSNLVIDKLLSSKSKFLSSLGKIALRLILK